jgi:hypothetical protein
VNKPHITRRFSHVQDATLLPTSWPGTPRRLGLRVGRPTGLPPRTERPASHHRQNRMFHPPRRIPARGLGSARRQPRAAAVATALLASFERRGVPAIRHSDMSVREDALGLWELGESARRAVGVAPTEWTRPTDRRQSGRARSQDIRPRGAVRIAGDAYVDGKERAMLPRSV